MPSFHANAFSQIGTAAALALSLLLSGCAVSTSFPDTTSEGAAIVLTGRVHGGQQPVTGSHIHVMQAASSSYGAASTSLLVANGVTVLSDTMGGYVPTDANGNFTVTGSYTCTSGAQVYLLATQGNPGLTAGTNNTGIGIMAGLGACPSTGTLAATTPYVYLDEVSTIATAYALAGFFTDATHLATNGSALATTGINNAAANIPQLSNIATGLALATTPNAQGTVPQTKIDTLANILATCINSNGSGCATLFSLAQNGSATPTETATAAINIAHNPGRNIAALYALASSSGPFQPTLSGAPNDFSLTVHFTPATALFASSGKIAIDAGGNVWAPGAGFKSVLGVSPLGAVTKTITLATGSGAYYALNVAVSPAGTIWAANAQLGYAQPTASAFTLASDSGATWAGTELAVAFDTANNAWVGNNYPASFGEFSASGVLVAASKNGYEPGGFAPLTSPTTYPYKVLATAVDSQNHVWGICNNCNGSSLTGLAAEITNTGTAISGATGDVASSIYYPSSVAIDASNNAWISDFGTGQLTEYSSTSTLLSGSGYPSTGSLGGLNSLAVDGKSNIWVAGAGSGTGVLFSFNQSGVLTSPAGGYQAPATTSYYGNSIAIDGSGNAWVLDYSGGLHETIGIAMPVVTPVTPSALGVRP